MNKIKVSKATNLQLDWLVCTASNKAPSHLGIWLDGHCLRGMFNYTTDWSLMGPIIEREGINLSVDYQDFALSLDMVQIGWKANLWNNSVPGTSGFLQWATGPTPLIAAARCYVASKLGEEVEVPEELT